MESASAAGLWYLFPDVPCISCILTNHCILKVMGFVAPVLLLLKFWQLAPGSHNWQQGLQQQRLSVRVRALLLDAVATRQWGLVPTRYCKFDSAGSLGPPCEMLKRLSFAILHLHNLSPYSLQIMNANPIQNEACHVNVYLIMPWQYLLRLEMVKKMFPLAVLSLWNRCGWGLEYPHSCPQFWRSKNNSNSTQFIELYFGR